MKQPGIHPQTPKLIWVEAETFDHFGGWTADWQFLPQVGSAYLMAIGYGRPVADATTRVAVKTKGPHRLWVRSKDWVPQHHPGRFQVGMDGKALPKEFGASGREGWVWEDGGVQDLQADFTLSLMDLTGYYGRCDALVFSSDLQWVPPHDPQDLYDLRQATGALGPVVEQGETFDVIVVGGGLAGCLAAVASARGGARTALIQNRGVLGGNASPEHMVPPVGSLDNLLDDDEKKWDPQETGLLEELNTGTGQFYFEVGKDFPTRLAALVAGEPGLEVFLNTHLAEVGCQPGNEKRIEWVVGQQVLGGQRRRFRAGLFIDCSGDGALGLGAGADMAKGREGRTQYGESKAPLVASAHTLGSSLKYWYAESAGPVAFATPPWATPFPNCASFPKDRHPVVPGPFDTQWMNELGGQLDTYRDAELIRDDLLRLIFGLWDHVKNHCTRAKDAAAKLELKWVSHVASVRESHRLLGPYVMTEADITGQTLHPDRVAYGAWGLDDHPSGGFFDDRHSDHTHKGLFFSIPFGSLYSRNVANLLMAGRNISASHVAMTATRVMRTTALMGQAVGTAAALCHRYQKEPRALAEKHIEDLQEQLLKDGAFLIERPSRDGGDLAPKARVSASSSPHLAPVVTAGHSRARLRAMTPGGTKDPRAWIPQGDDQSRTHGRAARLHTRAANEVSDQGNEVSDQATPFISLTWEQPVAFNVIHLAFQTQALAPDRFSVEARTGGSWQVLADISNTLRRRRFALPVGETTATDLRVVMHANPKGGGICQVRVHRESPAGLEVATRIHQTWNTNLESGNLPWSKS